MSAFKRFFHWTDRWTFSCKTCCTTTNQWQVQINWLTVDRVCTEGLFSIVGTTSQQNLRVCCHALQTCSPVKIQMNQSVKVLTKLWNLDALVSFLRRWCKRHKVDLPEWLTFALTHMKAHRSATGQRCMAAHSSSQAQHFQDYTCIAKPVWQKWCLTCLH